MGKLEVNVKKIIVALLEADDFITLEYLSTKCDVTRRSTQNHIQLIEAWLAENGFSEVSLVRKPGRGVKLVMDHALRLKIQQSMMEQNLDSFDDNARRLKMLKALIFSENELTIGFLADLFYMSRTVILKDLEWIGKWLEKFDLKLYKIQNRGIGILGDEVAKRNAIAAFFDNCMPNSKIELGKSVCLSRRVTEQHFARLQSLYLHIDISAVITLIEDAEKQFDFFLTDEYFVSLLTHLTISIARLKCGNQTEDNFCLDDNEFALVRGSAEFIAKRIHEIFGFKLPDTEITYICLHLMSYTMNNHVKTDKYAEDDPNSNDNNASLDALAISIIEFVNQQCAGTFITDKILYFEILSHLKTSVYRMKNRIYVNAISSEHDITLDKGLLSAVMQTENIFKEHCGLLPTTEEYHALTLHFMLSKNRSRQKSRAVLLNNTGVAAGIVLKDYLTEKINTLEIVDIVSYPFQIDLIAENKYDFVISNMAVENCRKPVANILQVQKSEYVPFLLDFMSNFI